MWGVLSLVRAELDVSPNGADGSCTLSSLPAPGNNTREQDSHVKGCKEHYIPWCLGMLEVEVAPSYAFLLQEFCFPPE